MISNKIMKMMLILLSLTVVVLVAVIVANASVSQRNYVEQMVNGFPVPGEKEFATYDSVINVFIKSIKENNPDQTFKCFPIKEYYYAYTLENYVKRVNMFSYTNSPIPGWDYVNYLKSIELFNREWVLLEYTALYSDQSEVIKKMGQIDLDTEDGKQKLEDIEKQIDVKRLKQLIGELKILKVTDMGVPNVIEQAMGVKERKVVETTLKINNDPDYPIMFNVGRIGSNWRIINIFQGMKF